MALDKMKAYLDASGNAVAKVGPRKSSAQRNGGSGIMKRLRDMRIPRSSPVKASSGQASAPTSPVSAALPDPIPSTPVVLTSIEQAHAGVTPQILTSNVSDGNDQEANTVEAMTKQDSKRKGRKGEKSGTPSKPGNTDAAADGSAPEGGGSAVKSKRSTHRMRSLTMPVGMSRPDPTKVKRLSPVPSTTPTRTTGSTTGDAATTASEQASTDR